jgi:glycosyltransferase involved in cell wall biosynthesis
MTARVAAPAAFGRVAVDVGAARTRPAGVGIYIVELIRGLDTIAPGQFVRIGVRGDGPLADGPVADGETRLDDRRHLYWLQRRADGDARAAGCGLVHYTNALAPLRGRLPFVLTIQDCSLIRMPGGHPRTRLPAIPFMIASARAAHTIIVPSEATRRELRRLLRIPDDRIVTIPYAARASAVQPVAGEVVGALGLGTHPYILTIGTIEPRKNHRRLLEAFERISTTDANLRLVVAGAWGWHANDFRRALAASPVRDRVIVTGYRTDAEVATLLSRCAVMAYPSIYEGFGLPVVEAMAVGAPVMTSRTSSLPEAAGGAAVLVDPFDVGSIADGLLDAMARREELSAAGRARVAGRTWLDVASETAEVYRRAGSVSG